MDDRDDITDGQEENVSSTTTVAVTTATTTISNVHDRLTMTPNAATTTTPSSNQSPQLATHKMPDGPPNEWSIEDVIQYISGTDAALAVHADLFRKHVSTTSSHSNIGFFSIVLSFTFIFNSLLIAIFSVQEIDGKAFLLLNFDTMMKYMNLKLGPALKICNLVSRVTGRRHV